MQRMCGQVNGIVVAVYKRGKFTLTCKKSNGFYCVTFHNGRYSNWTFYSKDKDEMNSYIKKSIAEGYKKVQ